MLYGFDARGSKELKHYSLVSVSEGVSELAKSVPKSMFPMFWSITQEPLDLLKLNFELLEILSMRCMYNFSQKCFFLFFKENEHNFTKWVLGYPSPVKYTYNVGDTATDIIIIWHQYKQQHKPWYIIKFAIFCSNYMNNDIKEQMEPKTEDTLSVTS